MIIIHRSLKRKLELVKSRGGELCGYDRNIAVLEFHHINPDEKEFQLDYPIQVWKGLKRKQINVNFYVLIVIEKYIILTWEKVAQHFGLTRRVIQGIRKKDS